MASRLCRDIRTYWVLVIVRLILNVIEAFLNLATCVQFTAIQNFRLSRAIIGKFSVKVFAFSRIACLNGDHYKRKLRVFLFNLSIKKYKFYTVVFWVTKCGKMEHSHSRQLSTCKSLRFGEYYKVLQNTWSLFNKLNFQTDIS